MKVPLDVRVPYIAVPLGTPIYPYLNKLKKATPMPGCHAATKGSISDSLQPLLLEVKAALAAPAKEDVKAEPKGKATGKGKGRAKAKSKGKAKAKAKAKAAADPPTSKKVGGWDVFTFTRGGSDKKAGNVWHKWVSSTGQSYYSLTKANEAGFEE